MKKPRISMITVSYNSAKTIERTIQSVRSQNYDNLDYVIIDGGSTDGTQEIVSKYRDVVTTFISEKDNGISDAFNKGIKNSDGDIVGIINSDDYLLPGALDKVAAAYDDKTDIYSGNIVIEDVLTGKRVKEVPSLKFPKIMLSPHIAHQGRFVAKKAYDKYGMYDEELHYMMDADFLERSYRNGAIFKYIDAELAVFTIGLGVTSDNPQKKKKEKIHIAQNNGYCKIYAYLGYYNLLLRFHIKNVLNRIAPNLAQKLRYKKQ